MLMKDVDVYRLLEECAAFILTTGIDHASHHQKGNNTENPNSSVAAMKTAYPTYLHFYESKVPKPNKI
jgi:hypothetical protein